MEQPALFGFPPWKPGSPTYRVPLVSLRLVREREIKFDAVPKVLAPGDVVPVLRQVIGGADREVMVAVCLDMKNRITAVNGVSIGTLTATHAVGREVFKAAVLANSAAIIVGHNHPSGDPAPSQSDFTAARSLKQAGEVLGVALLDFVVLGADRYVSFLEHGLL